MTGKVRGGVSFRLGEADRQSGPLPAVGAAEPAAPARRNAKCHLASLAWASAPVAMMSSDAGWVLDRTSTMAYLTALDVPESAPRWTPSPPDCRGDSK